MSISFLSKCLNLLDIGIVEAIAQDMSALGRIDALDFCSSVDQLLHPQVQKLGFDEFVVTGNVKHTSEQTEITRYLKSGIESVEPYLNHLTLVVVRIVGSHVLHDFANWQSLEASDSESFGSAIGLMQ